MIELILSLIKYTAIFTSMMYAFTKLLRIKLSAWDLFDIPLFIALSAVLHYVTVYVKILVPIGFLIFGIIFLFLRFRKTLYERFENTVDGRFKKTVYETVTVGTIALSISIVLMIPAFIGNYISALTMFRIEDKAVIRIITSLIASIVQIVGVFCLFKVERLQSGLNAKSKNATFDILLYISVVCIFTMTMLYAEEVKYYMLKVVLLVIALSGLLLVVWWCRHITYTYRERQEQKYVKYLEDKIAGYELNASQNKTQNDATKELIHYLNKTVKPCAALADEVAAEQTGSAKARGVSDYMQAIMEKLDLTNEKRILKGVPHTGEEVIDATIVDVYNEAAKKNLTLSAEIKADVKSWFSEGKLKNTDIQLLLSYLSDNGMNSALGLPKANVRFDFLETANKKPLIRIYDSGEHFDEEVLKKLGLEQYTTRADGNGIGLFEVFKTLKKYGASFTLDEEPQIFGFTKVIEIAFDGRHAVTVRTSRESVVTALSARKDISVELIEEEILRDGTNG